MSTKPNILVLAGSLRSGSFNKKVARIAAAEADKAGAETTYVDLKDFPLPLYDGDLENDHGLPENARKLKDMFIAADGIVIVSPEYNHSIPAVLKNVIDWLSRPAEGYANYSGFEHTVFALMSVSGGGFAGVRVLPDLRKVLSALKGLVLPEQVNIPNGGKAFDDNDQLKDEKQQAAVRRLTATLIKVVQSLSQ
ncbi:NAD(P)H-dependent oxidoreductase [bacterium]|nr:NAD(P)H-dependent oxidoreductase [bacterium]MCB2202364.1 NAD(P)H-dependent oxidoreductase [bacterium]